MGIHIGTSTKNQAAIQIGNTSMGKVYVGDKLVWQKNTGPDYSTHLKYGNYYNYYAAWQYSDQFIEGMRIPHITEFTSIIRYNNMADLVSDRVYPIPDPSWDTGKVTDQFTNALNFSVLPSGERSYQNGYAVLEGRAVYHWLIQSFGGIPISPSTYVPYMRYDKDSLHSGALSTSPRAGKCIRLCRDAVGDEISTPSGTILGTVQDYDGNSYELVKLYGRLEATNLYPVREYHLVFTVQDLLTKKLINGQNIPIIPHNTSGRNTWMTMETPGMSINLRN